MKTYKKLFLALIIGSICFSNVLGMSEELPTSPNTSPKLTSVESSTLPQSWKTRQHSEFETPEEQEERKELSVQSPLELSAFLKTLGKGNHPKKGLQIRMHIPDDSEEQEEQVENKFNLAPIFVQRIILHRYSDEQSKVFFENTPTIQYCDEDGNLGEEISLSLIDQQAKQGVIIREKRAGTLFVYIPVYHDAYKQGLSTFTFDIQQLTPGTSYQISLDYELSPEGVPTKAICSLEPIQGQESDVSVQDTIDLDPNSYII
jgi:hypothetical protein